MEMPKTDEELQLAIRGMTREISDCKLIIEKNGQTRLNIEKSIDEVKTLQSKAHFIIECYKKKDERYREQMKEIRRTYLMMSSLPLKIQTDSGVSIIQEKIRTLRDSIIQLNSGLDEMENTLIVEELQKISKEVDKLSCRIKTELSSIKIKKENFHR